VWCARRDLNPRPTGSKAIRKEGRSQPTPENRGRFSSLTAVRCAMRPRFRESVAHLLHIPYEVSSKLGAGLTLPGWPRDQCRANQGPLTA
jgi:hypothetical protein